MRKQEVRWKKKDRGWRRLRIREAVKRMKQPGNGGKLRPCLFALAGLELAVGAGQYWGGGGTALRFLHREESCCIEWVEQGGAGNGGQEIYGVRLRPDSLELQFYHRSQEIRPAE